MDQTTIEILCSAVFRGIGLSIGFFLVPRGSLPFAAKFAVWAIAVMCAPFDSVASTGFGQMLVGVDSRINEIFQGELLSYTLVIVECSIGIVIGISFGTSLLLSSIFGHMLSSSVLAKTSLHREGIEQRVHPTLSVLPVLISVSLIFGSGGYATLFGELSKSYSTMPPGMAMLTTDGFVAICKIIMHAGGTALMLATYIFIPLALVFFVCDFACVLSQRMLKELEAHWMFKGLRIPLLSLFLVLSLYPFSEQISVFFSASNSFQSAKPIAELFQVNGR